MPAGDRTFERHFSVDELSELWNMSDDFIRRLFLHETGVVVFYHYRPGRRVYRTLRIADRRRPKGGPISPDASD